MSLSPSSRIGPYEILTRLGAGAMGEVYRARDTRLGREVAVKILPADLSGDAGRRARFEQEARAVAALNHPNILGLYDIGSDNGVAYMVTELVSGETLEALLDRGPVPIKKLLDIAVQTADGMAAAHAARITHRDLKPANIMVAGDGRVKILDFGLAKQSAEQAADPDQTMTTAQTQPGMILGTINYMSPEQARGRPTDHRSDQFSFGLILYEMASGRKAFERAEAVETMAAILSEEPPPIERAIPPPLGWVIGRCLAKEPPDRYESSRDLFQELRSLRDHLGDASTSQTGSTRDPLGRPWSEAPIGHPGRGYQPRRWYVPAASALGLLVAFGIVLFRAGPSMPDQSSYRFTPFSFEPGGQYSPLWSPDGKAVAYAARVGAGPYQVFLRYLDSPTPVQLTHTADSASPAAWTPDGKRILLEIERDPPGLWSIATVGGEPEVVAAKVPYSRTDAISPDARTAAYFYSGDDGRAGVWLASPPGAAPVRYVPDPFATKDVYNNPRLKFSPDGKQMLLLLNAGRQREEAWILPFPASPSRPPHQVLADLKPFGGTPTFSWMPDNRHIALSLATLGDAAEQLWLADTVSGERHALTSGTAPRSFPAVSPDGSRIIFRESSGNYDIVSVDLANAALHPMMATDRDESMPAWSANQPALVYVTDRNGPPEIWLHTAGGADRPLVTARDFPPGTTQWLMGPAISPEAGRVTYTKIDPGGGVSHLWISAVTGGAPVPLTNDSASGEFPGSWSPDGSWFAYTAYRDGKPHLMKVKTSGQASPVMLKADAPYNNEAVPVWSPDGAWIAFGDNLYSSDGATVRSLGEHHQDAYVFAPDGKLVYGLRPDHDRELLFSVDIATQAEKIVGDVGQDFRPRSSLNPAIRLSLAPDGKSIVYAAIKQKNNLWMLEGFAAKTGLLARLGW